MRFTVTQELHHNKPLKWLLSAYFLSCLVFLICNWFFEGFRWGFSFQAVSEHVLGNDDLFLSPMSLENLLTEAHTQLFLYLTLSLSLLTVFLRTPLSYKLKGPIITFIFIFCLSDALAPLLVRFANPQFAYIKIFSFAAMNALWLYILSVNFLYLWGYWRDRQA